MATCILPLIASVVRYKLINSVLKPLFFLVILSVIIEALNEIHVGLDLNNFYLFHFFTIIEFTLISQFYHRFFKQYFNPLIIKILIFAFLIIAFIDYRLNGFNYVDNFSITIESVILTFYSVFFFYYILKNLLFENLLNAPFFWINTGVIIYFSGNLILFAFSNYLFETEPKKYHMLWYTVHAIINISYNILISVGFWKTKVK